MITITEIHPHYITGKLRLLKGYKVYFRLDNNIKDSEPMRLDGSVFIVSEKPVIDLNNMIARIKTNIGI